MQLSGSNSQPDISDHRLIQTTSDPSCVLGLGRAAKNPTDFTTDSDSASHIRAVPAGIAHNSQLRKSKRRPNGYQDVQSVASAVDRTVDSSWDCTTDLSAIPFPKSVSTSKPVTGVSIGRGSLSLGEASDSGSESRQSALFYSRLCRPRQGTQCVSASASASGSDVSDTEQGGRSPRKIGRGQMLAAARGDGPGDGRYDLTEDLVHKMDDLFRHGRQEMPKPDFGPVVDDKPKYGEKFTVSPPSSRHSLEGAKDPHASCVGASLPRKLGRGDLLATAVGYASDTGLEAVSAPTVPSLARGQLLGETIQSMDHRGFGRGRGCLSDSGDELRSLPKKFGRGQIQSMFSKSDCSSEVCSTPKPTSPAKLDSPPSALARTAGKSLGRGQFLLNLVTNKPVAVGARERPEMNSGRYEDAEEKIVNSSNVERDKSKNYKEESVTSKYQHDVDVTNHSVTSDSLRDAGSHSVTSKYQHDVDVTNHSVTSDSLRDAGSHSVTSDSLRGVGSHSVTSDSLRGVGSHSVTSDSLRDAGSRSVTSDSLLGVGSQCVASECERDAGVGSESVRNSSSLSNADSPPGWSLPFVKARRPKCAHDQMLQNQTGLPKETTSYKQTVPLKEMPYSQTLLLKEMAHSQTVLPKEMAHNQTVSPKEMAHNQTVSPKEMTHNQTVSPKMISHNQTVSPKATTSHKQIVSPREMTSCNQTVSLKDISHNQTVSPKEMMSHKQTVSPKEMTSHKQSVSPKEMTSHKQTLSPKEMTSHNQAVSPKEMTSHNQTIFPQTELAR